MVLGAVHLMEEGTGLALQRPMRQRQRVRGLLHEQLSLVVGMQQDGGHVGLPLQHVLGLVQPQLVLQLELQYQLRHDLLVAAGLHDPGHGGRVDVEDGGQLASEVGADVALGLQQRVDFDEEEARDEVRGVVPRMGLVQLVVLVGLVGLVGLVLVLGPAVPVLEVVGGVASYLLQHGRVCLAARRLGRGSGDRDSGAAPR